MWLWMWKDCGGRCFGHEHLRRTSRSPGAVGKSVALVVEVIAPYPASLMEIDQLEMKGEADRLITILIRL